MHLNQTGRMDFEDLSIVLLRSFWRVHVLSQETMLKGTLLCRNKSREAKCQTILLKVDTGVGAYPAKLPTFKINLFFFLILTHEK